jgi:hypothetical protein
MLIAAGPLLVIVPEVAENGLLEAVGISWPFWLVAMKGRVTRAHGMLPPSEPDRVTALALPCASLHTKLSPSVPLTTEVKALGDIDEERLDWVVLLPLFPTTTTS